MHETHENAPRHEQGQRGPRLSDSDSAPGAAWRLGAARRGDLATPFRLTRGTAGLHNAMPALQAASRLPGTAWPRQKGKEGCSRRAPKDIWLVPDRPAPGWKSLGPAAAPRRTTLASRATFSTLKARPRSSSSRCCCSSCPRRSSRSASCSRTLTAPCGCGHTAQRSTAQRSSTLRSAQHSSSALRSMQCSAAARRGQAPPGDEGVGRERAGGQRGTALRPGA